MPDYSFGLASSKSRAAKGHVIGALQNALGIALEVTANQAYYGQATTAAITSLQQDNGLPRTGRAGPNEFAILALPWPDIVERSIQLSASDGFEGASFTEAMGSLATSTDDGITWGIIGFTSSNGEVQDLLRDFRRSEPVKWQTLVAFLALSDRTALEGAINEGAPSAALGDWGLTEVGAKKTPTTSAKVFFDKIGGERTMQNLQMERARGTYWTVAQSLLAKAFAIELDAVEDLSPLAHALAYDIRVFSAGPEGDGHLRSDHERFHFDGFALLAAIQWEGEPERLGQIAEVTIARLTDRNAPDMVHVEGARRRWVKNMLADDGDDADLRSFALKPV